MKRFLKKYKHSIMEGRLRFISKIVYDLTIRSELRYHRVLDAIWKENYRKNFNMLDDLTVVIKTFERPKTVLRLIASIRRFYPEIKIVVADDSLTPRERESVTLIVLPFNSGVSAGRNEALKHVKTKYALLLDDDFIFCHKTNLLRNLDLMNRNPQIDILGGKVIYLPFYETIDYRLASLYPTESKPVLPIGSKISGLPVFDKVANFFICRPERVGKIGWDPLLKKLEHAEFFTRARGFLVTVYNEEFVCLHAPTPFDSNYMKYRNDCAYEAYWLKKKYYGK